MIVLAAWKGGGGWREGEMEEGRESEKEREREREREGGGTLILYLKSYYI